MLKRFAPLLSLLLSIQVNAAGHDVSSAPPTTPQLLPVLAANDREFIASWIEQGAKTRAVLAGRIDHQGQPEDGAGIALGGNIGPHPAIVRGASETLVAWSNSDGIFAARITPSGVLLGTTPVDVATSAYSAPVAATWDGSRYFVIWSDNQQQLTGAFVSPDGSVTTATVFMKAAATDRVFEPDVAWDGHEFIVTYATGFDASQICSPCTAFPDTIHLMGVSPSGAAIDPVPIRIAGTHLRAHVASSSAGILIVLDAAHDISTIQVQDVNGVLQLGSEVPLFHWFDHVSSGLAWDGAAYTIYYRYFATPDGASWIGTHRITDSGMSLQRRWVAAQTVGNNNFTDWWGPSVATNNLFETALVISEVAPGSNIPRARLYFGRETTAWHGLPGAPHDAVSHWSGGTASIEWQSGAPVDLSPVGGFLIEMSTDSGTTWTTAHVTTADEHSWTTAASAGQQFRISAIGGGGISDGTITTIHSEPRRHAERR
jgi:hypothetical protein